MSILNPESQETCDENSVRGTDINYTFGYVGIMQPVIDYTGNCGNTSAAVGPFALIEPNEVYRRVQPANPPSVCIGYPSGTLELERRVEDQNGTFTLSKSALARAARLLMDGSVCVPERVVAS